MQREERDHCFGLATRQLLVIGLILAGDSGFAPAESLSILLFPLFSLDVSGLNQVVSSLVADLPFSLGPESRAGIDTARFFGISCGCGCEPQHTEERMLLSRGPSSKERRGIGDDSDADPDLADELEASVQWPRSLGAATKRTRLRARISCAAAQA